MARLRHLMTDRVSASISSPVIANATACRHPAMMLLSLINHKRGIRQQITRSMISFMDLSSRSLSE